MYFYNEYNDLFNYIAEKLNANKNHDFAKDLDFMKVIGSHTDVKAMIKTGYLTEEKLAKRYLAEKLYNNTTPYRFLSKVAISNQVEISTYVFNAQIKDAFEYLKPTLDTAEYKKLLDENTCIFDINDIADEQLVIFNYYRNNHYGKKLSAEPSSQVIILNKFIDEIEETDDKDMKYLKIHQFLYVLKRILWEHMVILTDPYPYDYSDFAEMSKVEGVYEKYKDSHIWGNLFVIMAGMGKIFKPFLEIYNKSKEYEKEMK